MCGGFKQHRLFTGLPKADYCYWFVSFCKLVQFFRCLTPHHRELSDDYRSVAEVFAVEIPHRFP